jgi:CheY-like chemotaxis protein
VDCPAQKSSLILLVDDDARTARVLARMLTDDGFDVELATDGAAAIGRLGRAPIPDVLVTDLRMPHADGMAVARYARSRSPAMPVILLTVYPELVPALQAGFDPPLVLHTKPIDYARLREVLSACESAAEQAPSG